MYRSALFTLRVAPSNVRAQPASTLDFRFTLHAAAAADALDGVPSPILRRSLVCELNHSIYIETTLSYFATKYCGTKFVVYCTVWSVIVEWSSSSGRT